MFVHDPAIRTEALELVKSGLNDCEIARRLSIPRSTIRDWRRPRYVPRKTLRTCLRCWRPTRREIDFTHADYAELLGLYLGDGHIVRTGRSDRLRLFLDSRYPEIVCDVHALLQRSFPGGAVGRQLRKDGRLTILGVYSTHLRCLFPQHGPGRKHHRRIVLEGWQQAILARHPWPFLRGCIRSDGCVFINRTGRYSYVSYDFKNRSRDILDLFTHACELVGVEHRRYEEHVRVYRRSSVALMLRHVGTKR
jgi:hypothetical protein